MARELMRDEVEIWWESYDDPWSRMYDIAKILVQKDSQSTIFDLFNFIREDVFGGWKMDEESPMIKRIDAEIEYESRYG